MVILFVPDELLATVAERKFTDDLVLHYLETNGFDEVREDLLKVIKQNRTSGEKTVSVVVFENRNPAL